jgi:oxygen-independent coproporphyrinogen-3 oxidase
MAGLYIHIPFCVAKCAYCDFNSRSAPAPLVAAYLAALRDELASTGRRWPHPVDTLHVGGGTPTTLDRRSLAGLLDRVRSSFRVAPGAEVAVEANPGTIGRGSAAALRETGFNRVSLGVQSLDDRVLAAIGRAHDAAAARRAYDALRRAGFDNVGIDLIHGLPGQTVAGWRRDLARVISWGPEHLSLYGLGLERGTPLARQVRRGAVSLPPEEESAAMYDAAREMAAAAGYEQYEISNWARPGFRSRHNVGYWTGEAYAAAGAGAHSYGGRLDPVRRANVRRIESYIGRIVAGRSPVSFRERLEPRRARAEALMLSLRLTAGVSPAAFAAAWGGDPLEEFAPAIARATGKGIVEIAGGRLRLTPAGVLLSNDFFRDLF